MAVAELVEANQDLLAAQAVAAIENAAVEEVRRRGEDKFRAVFDHAFCAILIVDDAQTILDANQAAGQLLGVCHEELHGRHLNIFSEPVLSRETPDWDAAWAGFIAEGEFSGERIIRSADGSERRVFYHAKANYQPGEHLCVLLDVTRLRLSEQAVAQTEQLYRTLVDATSTGYCVVDTQGMIIDANAEYVRLAGFANLEEIRGRNVQEWTAPHDLARNAEELRRCVEEGSVRDLEIGLVDRAGNITPVEVNARSIPMETGTLLLALVRNIAGRHSVQQELRAARAELESRVHERTAELARANTRIRQRALQQEAVAAFGHKAVMGSALDTLLQEAAEQVAGTLEVAMSCIMEHGTHRTEEFVLRACVGWPEAPLGRRASYAGKKTLAGEVFHSRQPLIIEDLSLASDYCAVFDGSRPRLLSGMCVVICGEAAPYGVLMAHSANRREFSQDDVHFLQSIANILAAAIERKHAEQAIQTARQEAVRANDAKSDFLSRMSHELRTPLNAILGFGQLLEIEDLSASQEESVDQIVQAGRHLLNLVNEVLDISRIETGQLSMAPEPVAVAAVVREAVDLIRPLAAARQVTLTVRPEIVSGGWHVLADRQRFRQVLLNLLSNAVKYNRDGGSVEIAGGSSRQEDYLRLEVRDTGPGIPHTKLARLFTPFERLGAEYTGVEGNGMGLALCKRLIDSQRGFIGAESEEKEGSTFWIELPSVAAPSQDAALSVTDLEEIFAPSLLLGEEPEEGYAPAPVAGTPSPKQLVVLHVEDNESNRRLIEMLLLQRPGLRLVSAVCGEDGLKLAREHRPALILLDMHLPDTTGEEVLSQLRSEVGTRDTPVIVVSADATAARNQKLRAAGANDYLTKPFNVVQFLHILDEYLFQKEAGK